MKPSVGLRLALAYLYSVSDRKDRDCYNRFWVTATGQAEHPGAQPDYVRGTYSCTYLQGISRSVGIEYTVDVSHKLRDGHQHKDRPKVPMPPDQRAKFAEAQETGGNP